MSIRVTALILLVTFLSFYAWRSWFFSLCWAVALVAVIQHPDYPRNIADIQGLNPWNLLMLSVILAWFGQRQEEGLEWDFPTSVMLMIFCAFAVVLFGAARLILADHIRFPISYVLSESIVNSVKWLIPGLLLYDGCRTRKRMMIALGTVLAVYFLLGVQVVRWMPLGQAMAGGDDMTIRASKIVQNEVGYNRVTLSMMLAGASWAIVSAVPLVQRNFYRLAILGAAGVVVLAQALTGGRTGYVAWAAVGLALCTLRWRMLLPLIPVAVIAIGIALPGVRERVFAGFGGQEGNIVVQTSDYEKTSGRNIAWPLVIDKILEAPLIGYGREAMTTTGLQYELMVGYGEAFAHPHQAYLQQLLDNGIIGFLLFMPIFFYVIWRCVPLILVRDDALICAVGCAAFALVMALMIGALGGQTFYPREGSVCMWAAIGLMLRASLQWREAQMTGGPVFEDDEPVLENESEWGVEDAWVEIE